jgi:hypothetical protein
MSTTADATTEPQTALPVKPDMAPAPSEGKQSHPEHWCVRLRKPSLLATLNVHGAIRHAAGYAWVTFVVSVVVGLVSLRIGGRGEHVLAWAVAGQLSSAMTKLMSYSALVALGLAVALMPTVLRRPARWVAGYIAKVAFDYLSGAVGVVAGLAVAMTVESGWLGLAHGLWLVVVFVTAQLAMYVPVRMIYGRTSFDFVRHARPAFVGALITVLGLWGFVHETWSDTDPPACVGPTR